MLRAVYSHRLEELAAALADDLARRRRDGELGPFDPVTIVVPGRAMAAWLERALARRLGIAANLRFPFLESFLAEVAATTRPDARVVDRALLRVLIARALADPALMARPEMARPAAYLEGPGVDRDRLRLELADRLAALYVEYELTRPEWLAAWRRDATATVPESARRDEAWQRGVWRAVLGERGLVARLARGAPWATAPALLEAAHPDQLARSGPVALFGFGHLAPRYLALLERLAAAVPVALYLPSPCRQFWDDVGEDPADAPLLALWGRAARELVRLVGERTGFDAEERYPEPPPPATALAALQLGVLDRAAVAPDGDGPRHEDAALEIIAAPGVRRELELIADRIWALVAADPTLRLDHIAVLLAGDQRALYQAHLPSVFHERCALPHHMVDVPLGRQSRVAEAVGLVLDLPLGQLTRAELAAVLLHPAVLAGAPAASGDDWLAWIRRLGIVRGGDHGDHAATYIDQDVFNWEQGLRRLALGAVMEGEKSGELRAVGVGAYRYLPEEIAAGETASAAALAGLVRRLVGAAREARAPRPLAAWARFADGLIGGLIHARGDADEQALARCRLAIGGLAELDLDGEPVSYTVFRQLLAGPLGALRGSTGDLLAAGVLVAPLGHAPLPFRVVFVAGLGEGRFPGRDSSGALDLRADQRRAGDLSARDRDLGALLDAVLSARERLVLSYVGRDEKTGDTVGRSSAVLDLEEAFRAYHRGSVVTEHSRDRAPAPLDLGGAVVVTADPIGERHVRARALRADLERHWRAHGRATPSEEAMRRAMATAPPEVRALVDAHAIAEGDGEARRELGLRTLRRFLEDPVQAWAAAVLGVADEDDGDQRDVSDEPVERGAGEASTLLCDSIGAYLLAGGGDLDALFARHRERAGRLMLAGLAPVGRLGDLQRAVDEDALARLHATLAAFDLGAPRAVGFGRVRAGAVINERRPPLALPAAGDAGAIELHGPCQPYAGAAGLVVVTTSGKLGFRHLVRGALDLVALVAAGALPPGGHPLTLLGPRVKTTRYRLELDAAAALAYLGGLADELLAHRHDYLLPGEAAWKLVREPGEHALDALIESHLTQAERRPWSDGPVARLERLAIPPDADAIIDRRLGWLHARLEALP